MVKELMIVSMLSLVCPETNVTNVSDEPWNEHDQKILDQYKERCKDFPIRKCLIYFSKREPRNYHAVCGQKRKIKKKRELI